MNFRDIEYEDAYVLEEKYLVNQIDADLLSISEKEHLTLGSLNVSDELDDITFDELTSDYNKLKAASELTKKKLEKQSDFNDNFSEFQPRVVKREEVVEDYIKNYFFSNKLVKTLNEFNKEYTELSKKGKFNDNYIGSLTDIHIKNAKLEEKLDRMEKELEIAKKNAEEAKSQWESLRKERDFHKENYSKTVNEKDAILTDYKTLNNLHGDFQSKIGDLKLKYEHLCKLKSLMKLDSEKLGREREQKTAEKNKLQLDLERFDFKVKKDTEEKEKKNKIFNLPGLSGKERTPWPSDVRNNQYLLKTYNPMNLNLNISKQIKAHETKPASCISVHYKMHVVATGGDDATFKIWDMKNNEELASEIGHSEYITGVDLHPKGMFLATCSGDNTVKLWDLYNLKAKATFYDHNAVVWSVKFHDTGDFLMSCSEDSTIKLYDLNHEKCRSKYTGHTDSVNKINFQPFTNYFASCSADKSISIWDMRLGLTVQTFYGHMNNINDVIFNAKGDLLYSCDADGVVKSWDIRKVSELNTWSFDTRRVSANCLEVDKTNSCVYVGMDDGYLNTINLNKNTIGPKMKGHEISINAMGINPTNMNLYTVGSDGFLTTWQ